MRISENDKNDKFQLFYEDHYKFFLIIAYRILADNQYAENAVNDAFLKLYNKFDLLLSLDDEQRIAYSVRTVRNCSLTTLNKLKKEGDYYHLDETFCSGTGDTKTPEHTLIEKEEADEMKARIREHLTDRQQKVLELHIEGYSNLEISEKLNMSYSNTTKHLHKARKKLIALLIFMFIVVLAACSNRIREFIIELLDGFGVITTEHLQTDIGQITIPEIDGYISNVQRLENSLICQYLNEKGQPQFSLTVVPKMDVFFDIEQAETIIIANCGTVIFKQDSETVVGNYIYIGYYGDFVIQVSGQLDDKTAIEIYQKIIEEEDD